MLVRQLSEQPQPLAARILLLLGDGDLIVGGDHLGEGDLLLRTFHSEIK